MSLLWHTRKQTERKSQSSLPRSQVCFQESSDVETVLSGDASRGSHHRGASLKVEQAHLLYEERVWRTANMKRDRSYRMLVLGRIALSLSLSLSMRVPNPSPALERNCAPMGPDILSSTGAGVWRKASRVRYFRNPCDRDPPTRNFKNFKFFKNPLKVLNVYIWGKSVYFWGTNIYFWG